MMSQLPAAANPVHQDSTTSPTPQLFEPVTNVAAGTLERINAEPNFRSALVSCLQRYRLNHTRDDQTKQRWADIQQLESEWRQTLCAPSSATESDSAFKFHQDIFLKNTTAYAEYRSRVLGWFDARPNIQDRINARSITVEEAKEICLLFYNILECGSLVEKEVALQHPGVEYWQVQDALGCPQLQDEQDADDTSTTLHPASIPCFVSHSNIREAVSVDDILEAATRNLLSISAADISNPEQHRRRSADPFNNSLTLVRFFSAFPHHPSQLEPIISTHPDIRLALLQWLFTIHQQERHPEKHSNGRASQAMSQGYEFWSNIDLLSTMSEPNADTITTFVEAVQQRRHIISRFESWVATHGNRFTTSSEPPGITVAEARHLLGTLCEIIDAHTVVVSTTRVQLHLQLHVVLADYTAATASTVDPNDRNFLLHRNIASIERAYTSLLTRFPPENIETAAEKRATMNAYIAAYEQLRRVYAGMRAYAEVNSHIGTAASDVAITSNDVPNDLAQQAFTLLDERKTAYRSINLAVGRNHLPLLLPILDKTAEADHALIRIMMLCAAIVTVPLS
ncbi:hypothetical protein DV736_g927, partial [Chaetothyriales sp. CBS 134916]